MKSALFLLLAFVAGADGFAIFAPFLTVCVALLYLLRRRRGAA